MVGGLDGRTLGNGNFMYFKPASEVEKLSRAKTEKEKRKKSVRLLSLRHFRVYRSMSHTSEELLINLLAIHHPKVESANRFIFTTSWVERVF